MSEVCLITGGSRGIGREAALALTQKGLTVYVCSRHKSVLPGVKHIACDVTSEEAVNRMVEQICREQGHLDILICNAGYGISGAAEFTDNQQAKALLEVNLFGAVNSVRAVIPQMRKQRKGRIVFVSSLASPIAIPFQAWYSVSKAAVSAYADALRVEVAPFGITVTCILPGDTHTDFTAFRQKSPIGDDVYAGRIARSVAVMEKDEMNGMPASIVGKYLARVALKRHPKPAYGVGMGNKSLLLLKKLLPARLVSALVGKLYG